MKIVEANDVFELCEKLFGNEQQGFFADNLEKAIETADENFNPKVKHFYISILLRNDPLRVGKMLFIFIPRYSCPDPHPNHIVYKFERKTRKKKILWVLPDPKMIVNYSVCLPNLQNKEFLGLYHFARNYVSGDLQKLANEENKFSLM